MNRAKKRLQMQYQHEQIKRPFRRQTPEQSEPQITAVWANKYNLSTTQTLTLIKLLFTTL